MKIIYFIIDAKHPRDAKGRTRATSSAGITSSDWQIPALVASRVGDALTALYELEPQARVMGFRVEEEDL